MLLLFIFWKWINGLPVMMHTSEMEDNRAIQIKVGQDNIPYTIQQKDFTEFHTTLGVQMSSSGVEDKQVEDLKVKVYQFATAVASFNLTYAYNVYRSRWAPTICYSLGSTTMSSKSLQAIQASATGNFLSSMGFNRNFDQWFWSSRARQIKFLSPSSQARGLSDYVSAGTGS